MLHCKKQVPTTRKPVRMTQSRGRLDKNEGSYYTPRHIADMILDIAGYTVDNPIILSSAIIDPAAGDGALLVPAAERLVEAGRGEMGEGEMAERIAGNLSAYELDGAELAKAKLAVCEATRSLGVPLTPEALANFECGDACRLFERDAGKFDYVVGNPPYVRIHNLGEKPESRYIEGMCDLYYVFFDIGQQLLAENGRMCYIAPSSWFSAKAGRLMRGDLEQRRCISDVCDFGHHQIFGGYATTYTAIVALDGRQHDTLTLHPIGADGAPLPIETVPQAACWVDGLFMPGCPEWMGEALSSGGGVRVLNGYATNLDSVYISKEQRFPDSDLERPIVKASKCEKHHMLYPYDREGQLVAFEDIQRKCPEAAGVLLENKPALLARTQVEPDRWWCFARSQGIADTFRDKVAFQGMVKPGFPVRTMEAPAGCGVYGGVYAVGSERDGIDAALNSPEFLDYARALRKYKSGGYYAFGGKDAEHFINWYITNRSRETENGHGEKE